MSLTRALLSSTMESSMVDVSKYNVKAMMTSEYLDSACESLIKDIYDADKAFMVADVIGECKVLTEGADPEVLLEGMISDAMSKLKEGFEKFLAKIKEWFAKVKKFFQVLFMNGKELAKKYGAEIRKKSVKGFKYKGFEYKISDGDALVESISNDVATEIDKLVGRIEELKDLTPGDLETRLKDRTKTITGYNKDDAYKNTGAWESKARGLDNESKKITSHFVTSADSEMSSTDYQDKLVSAICKGASDISEMGETIEEKYRNGDTEKYEIDEFEANDRSDMLDFLTKFDKAISDMNKAEKQFEKDVNVVIKALDKLGSKKETLDVNQKDGTKMGTKEVSYKLASKISSFISSALAVRKTACDKKVSIYKEINSSWTSVLKSFVLKKEVKESAFFDDFDSMIALTEAADVEPEVDTGDEEDVNESYYSNRYSSSNSLLEAAYSYL